MALTHGPDLPNQGPFRTGQASALGAHSRPAPRTASLPSASAYLTLDLARRSADNPPALWPERSMTVHVGAPGGCARLRSNPASGAHFTLRVDKVCGLNT
jgi:hypothetical protein